MTDYERLPEVVPNLAVCERVQTPSGMSRRVTRLRQVCHKKCACRSSAKPLCIGTECCLSTACSKLLALCKIYGIFKQATWALVIHMAARQVNMRMPRVTCALCLVVCCSCYLQVRHPCCSSDSHQSTGQIALAADQQGGMLSSIAECISAVL